MTSRSRRKKQPLREFSKGQGRPPSYPYRHRQLLPGESYDIENPRVWHKAKVAAYRYGSAHGFVFEAYQVIVGGNRRVLEITRVK